MSDWKSVALENRGLAECIVVLEAYKEECDNKAEVECVLRRMTDRFEWTVYTLKHMDKPVDAEPVIDPNCELYTEEEKKAKEYHDKLMALPYGENKKE
jgi:hypothetical protein